MFSEGPRWGFFGFCMIHDHVGSFMFSTFCEKCWFFIGKGGTANMMVFTMVLMYFNRFDPLGKHNKWKNKAFGIKCYFNYEKNSPRSDFLRFQGSFQDPLATKRPSGNNVKKTTIFNEKIVFRAVRRLVVRGGWTGKGGTYVAPPTTIVESTTLGGRLPRY